MEAVQLNQLRAQAQAPAEVKMPAVTMGFFDLQGFELLQRVAKAFSSSDLVPKQYQGNLPNTMIAMDMAQRMRANPLMIMQNLYIVHGTPGWSSKFLIATVNLCGRFSSLRYEWKGEPGKPDFGCRAWAIERETGERLDGIWVTWAMVRAEGWDAKNGSKWKTMPDQMFIYRSAAFWQRGYAPELAMGMQTAEELEDAIDAVKGADGSYSVDLSKLKTGAAHQQEPQQPETIQQEALPEHSPSEFFGDALQAARVGDADTALDLARSCSADERQVVDQTLAAFQSHQQNATANGPATGARRSRIQSME